MITHKKKKRGHSSPFNVGLFLLCILSAVILLSVSMLANDRTPETVVTVAQQPILQPAPLKDSIIDTDSMRFYMVETVAVLVDGYLRGYRIETEVVLQEETRATFLNECPLRICGFDLYEHSTLRISRTLYRWNFETDQWDIQSGCTHFYRWIDL